MPRGGDDRSNKSEVLITSPTFLKGLAAGAIVSHLNKQMALGFVIGGLAGAYMEQR